MAEAKQILIMAGDGINCERETANAFREAGAVPRIVHVNDLLHNPGILKEMSALAIPGGFSFGDELGSGQVLALKLKHGLLDEFHRFIAQKRPIIGICNGFQVLVKLGLLPDMDQPRRIALAANESGEFIDTWTNLSVPKNTKCLWTKNLINEEKFSLPVRHGEGRIILEKGNEESVYQELLNNGQVALTYNENINGSYKNIAGLCDPTGLILGLMPHPEAYIYEATSKNHQAESYDQVAVGQKIFNEIVNYIE